MTRSTTRERMIDTALQLFRREGYRATSWRRLVDEAGTPWGSAYHHFPGGKEQLGADAIALGTEIVAETARKAFQRNESAESAVRWWFRKTGEALRRDDYRAGCPVATIALETAHTSSRLTTSITTAFETWHALLVGLYGDHGHGDRADELATATVTALEGALLLARVRRSTEPLDLAADHLALLLADSGRADG